MFLREEWLVSRVFVSANFVLFRAGVVFGLVGMRLALELRLLAPHVGIENSPGLEGRRIFVGF